MQVLPLTVFRRQEQKVMNETEEVIIFCSLSFYSVKSADLSLIPEGISRKKKKLHYNIWKCDMPT